MMAEFNAAQAPVRTRQILDHFDANKLTQAERDAVLSLMQASDLDALGIRIMPGSGSNNRSGIGRSNISIAGGGRR